MQKPFEEWRLALYSVNNFSSKKTSIDCSRERPYNAIELSLPVYVEPFFCVMPLCDMSLSVMAICIIGLLPFSFGLMHSCLDDFLSITDY